MLKQDFNRGWRVYKEGCETEGKEVHLPHDAMIYEERRKEAKTGGAGGYFEGGKYIYTKRLNVPAEWENQTIIVEFEAVYKNTEVYVNGVLAARRPYGYSNFYVDLSSNLKIGEENELKVVADNSKCPNSRWYSGSGIYREVQLYTAGKSYIKPEGVKVTTVDAQTIKVEVESVGGDKIQVEILDGETVITSAAAGTGESKRAEFTFTIADAKLWDAEHPNLYLCKATLEENGEPADTCSEEFGIRTLSWDTNGFFVNGKETLLRGGCIHHDNGILGACDFADAEERRVRILKEAGFNAIRCAHNPMSKAMLRACDRLGMYVMDESFDQWIIHKNPYDYAKEDFEIWWKEDTKAMISKDYNHPSVVMYSIGNEISELGIPEGQALCKEMSEFVKELDSTRAVTAGVNIMLATMAAKGNGLYGKDKNGEDKQTGSQSMDNMPTSTFFNMMMNLAGDMMDKMSTGKKADAATENAFSSLDISGYNYATSRYEKDGVKYPDRIIVGSETLPKKLYKNWKLVEKLPYLIGDFMWTSWDYLGEAGIGTIQYKSFKQPGNDGMIVSGGCGIVDICGKQRPEVEWGKIIWGLRDTPAIGVDPVTHSGDKMSASMWRDTDAVESWSWAGYEGRKTKVVVYSDAAKVELKVNEKSYGKKTVKECKAFFKGVEYQPGRIEAIAYDASGREVSRSELRTAAGATSLKLTPEKVSLCANGQDLCYLNIDLVGEYGITKASEDRKVTVKVEGAGTLQALGSARPNMSENFYSDTHTTYYGKALAVIRAGYEPGEITVTVSAEGLEPQTLNVEVR